MSKIRNSQDTCTPPTQGINKTIDFIREAERDHDNDRNWDAIMELLANEEIPQAYRLARLQMMIEALQEGLNQLTTQTDA